MARWILIVWLSALASCVSGRTQAGHAEVLRAVRAASAVSAHVEHAGLAREAKLEAILALALRRNPDLDEARLRVEAMLSRVAMAGRWPDLEWKQEVWGIPLARPWGVDRAQMLMFGLRQTIPAPGTVDARARAALEDARLGDAQREVRALELATRVRRVYLEYYLAGEERRVLSEQLKLLGRMIELARGSYRAGLGGQADVLRLSLEAARLRGELTTVDQQLASARVVLNALMDRRLDAPLGPAPEPRPEAARVRLAELERSLAERLPELGAARAAIRRGEAVLAGARAGSRWPSFMVGVDYMLMPTGTEHKHGYGAMLGINLPWFSRRRRDEVREAEHVVAAEHRALDATRLFARQQLRDAALRYEAARVRLSIVEGQVLIDARRMLESAQAAYSAPQSGDALGLLDALRSQLAARIERARTLVRLQLALVDLERWAGGAAPRGRDKESGR